MLVIFHLIRASIRVGFYYVVVRHLIGDIKDLLNWFYGISFADGCWLAIVVAVWLIIESHIEDWAEGKRAEILERIEEHQKDLDDK